MPILWAAEVSKEAKKPQRHSHKMQIIKKALRKQQ